MQNLLSYLEMAKRVMSWFCAHFSRLHLAYAVGEIVCAYSTLKGSTTRVPSLSLYGQVIGDVYKEKAVMAWKYIGLLSRRVSDSWSLYDSRQDSLILSLGKVVDFVNFLRMYND